MGDGLTRRLRILSAIHARRRSQLAADLEEAADAIDGLLTECAHLRAEVAQHQFVAMMHDTIGKPQQGPCHPNSYSTPHQWERIPFSDSAVKCRICGTVSSK